MSLSVQPPVEDKRSTGGFNALLQASTRDLLRNVWEFAERKPTAIYSFVDFEVKAADTFVLLDGKVYSPLELHLLPKYNFDPLPARREMFLGYLQGGIQVLEGIWVPAGKLRPRRMWMGLYDELRKERIIFDYSPLVTTPILPPVEEVVQRFRDEVAMGVWPHPALAF